MTTVTATSNSLGVSWSAPQRRRRRFSCCCLCCWHLAATLVLSFLLLVSGGIAYLWFQPLPFLRIQSVQALRFRVATRSRSDGTFVDVTTAVRILASNPNDKIGLAYDGGEGRVTVVDNDGDVEVGTTSIAGFEQGKKNATVVRFSASTKGKKNARYLDRLSPPSIDLLSSSIDLLPLSDLHHLERIRRCLI